MSSSAPPRDDEIAERGAPDLESVLANRGEVGAARHERHVVAGPRQLRAEVAADRPGSENGNFHRQAIFAEFRFENQYTGSPTARRPRPAKDSFGRSTSVFTTNAVEARMNTPGTNG